MIKSYRAAEDIPAYRFVKFASDGEIATASAGSDNIIGVSEEINNKAGMATDTYIAGSFAEVMAGGTFVAGDMLTTDAEGRAVIATPEDNIAAVALQDATAEGDIVQVVVQLQRVIKAAQSDSTT